MFPQFCGMTGEADRGNWEVIYSKDWNEKEWGQNRIFIVQDMEATYIHQKDQGGITGEGLNVENISIIGLHRFWQCRWKKYSYWLSCVQIKPNFPTFLSELYIILEIELTITTARMGKNFTPERPNNLLDIISCQVPVVLGKSKKWESWDNIQEEHTRNTLNHIQPENYYKIPIQVHSEIPTPFFIRNSIRWTLLCVLLHTVIIELNHFVSTMPNDQYQACHFHWTMTLQRYSVTLSISKLHL